MCADGSASEQEDFELTVQPCTGRAPNRGFGPAPSLTASWGLRLGSASASGSEDEVVEEHLAFLGVGLRGSGHGDDVHVVRFVFRHPLCTGVRKNGQHKY
jgi:hypothetical protein